MMDPVRELKIRAEILHTRITNDDASAIERLRALPELRKADPAGLAAMAEKARLKHCRAVVAREAGFASWEHARRVLDGIPEELDFGTLLYGPSGMLNHWFARYEEARAYVDEAGAAGGPRTYLLVYKRHFFVVDRNFIEAIGLGPDDPDWEAICWDWARPKTAEARRRLYMKRLTALLPPS